MAVKISVIWLCCGIVAQALVFAAVWLRYYSCCKFLDPNWAEDFLPRRPQSQLLIIFQVLGPIGLGIAAVWLVITGAAYLADLAFYKET